ncbi:uncharacterized protein LOC131952310 [Physella acuta]|uniref:uncharacterized protein LOC131952310 n=1 Tax=Physella acuta TaxID=109671 RepID=UPI0027DB810D|nr:uncharacterized protein LOC131952310 [Physella acuta]XP_059170901.1 uncharacterized protein LOC131952310 [Physella acuta]
MEKNMVFADDMMRCISSLWQDNDETYFDFVVQVGLKKFKCHRFILGACSQFFLGLFRSGMQETENNCVEIKEIGSDIFELILRAIYTSQNIIDEINIYKIWQATNQLQIKFLIDACESFVLRHLSLNTYAETYTTAKLLDSLDVLENCVNFIIKNFDNCKNSETLLRLTNEEIMKLVESPDLVAENEDSVLTYILNWINFDPDACVENLGDAVMAGVENEIITKFTKPSVVKDTILKTKMSEDKAIQSDFKNNSFQENSNDFPQYETKNHIANVKEEEQEDTSLDFGECKEEKCTRIKMLIPLLKVARINLVSSSSLRWISKNKAIKGNDIATEIVFNASLYHSLGGDHGQWPNGANHRRCSPWINLGVRVNQNNEVIGISFRDKQRFKLPQNTELQHPVQITSYKNKLYMVGQNVFNLYVLKNKTWLNIGSAQKKQKGPSVVSIEPALSRQAPTFNFGAGSTSFSKPLVSSPQLSNLMPQLSTSVDAFKKTLIVTVEQYIYLFCCTDKKIYRMNSQLPGDCLTYETKYPTSELIDYASSYDNKILVFYTLTKSTVDETAVHCYDIVNKTWIRLNNLEGSAKNMICFSDENNFFILKSNGDLWKTDSSNHDMIDFTFITKLWDFEYKLHGAVTYYDELFIYGEDLLVKPIDKIWPTSCALFTKIHVLGQAGQSSNFIPCILPKSLLVLDCALNFEGCTVEPENVSREEDATGEDWNKLLLNH